MSPLYADYRGTRQISVADYEAMGDLTDVVNNEIDEILHQRPVGRTQALDLLREAFIPRPATVNPLNDAYKWLAAKSAPWPTMPFAA